MTIARPVHDMLSIDKSDIKIINGSEKQFYLNFVLSIYLAILGSLAGARLSRLVVASNITIVFVPILNFSGDVAKKILRMMFSAKRCNIKLLRRVSTHAAASAFAVRRHRQNLTVARITPLVLQLEDSICFHDVCSAVSVTVRYSNGQR